MLCGVYSLLLIVAWLSTYSIFCTVSSYIYHHLPTYPNPFIPSNNPRGSMPLKCFHFAPLDPCQTPRLACRPFHLPVQCPSSILFQATSAWKHLAISCHSYLVIIGGQWTGNSASNGRVRKLQHLCNTTNTPPNVWVSKRPTLRIAHGARWASSASPIMEEVPSFTMPAHTAFDFGWWRLCDTKRGA